MNIITCLKVVPDAENLRVNPDRTLSFSGAKPVISSFDVYSIEAGARLIEENGGTLTALSIGGGEIDDSKLKKSVLSRGPDRLFMVADETLAALDTYQTAIALKEAIAAIGDYDLILCGEGSEDLYAQQVGPQLGQMLNVPCVNAVSKITAEDGKLIVERTLENEVETLELTLPAVVSVTSDINVPRIPNMKAILAAGKKPMTIWTAADIGLGARADTIEVLETKAPKQTERKQIVVEGDSDEAIQEFLANISAVLG